jgi:pimeloyl-ACP methyl ester carboxylesterase
MPPIRPPAMLLCGTLAACSASPLEALGGGLTTGADARTPASGTSIHSTPHRGTRESSTVLRRVRARALVVEGSESGVPLDATRVWAQELPSGRRLLIPGAGHRPWLDRPKPYFAAVDTFLRGRWPTRTDLE